MSGHLFVISGASGSGKSALLELIAKSDKLSAALVTKYTTRKARRGVFKDVVTVPAIRDDEYSFVYPFYEHVYGLKASDITKLLASGRDAFVIVSDLRVVAEIKRYFGSLAVSLYVFRNITGRQLGKLLDRRASEQSAGSSDRQTRLNRLYLMQRQYVENISLFDHVILNTTTKTAMLAQVTRLVEAYRSGHRRPNTRGPVVFLIAAASGAGKRTLMQAMLTFGRRDIRVIRKATTRKLHRDDGPEIYHVTKKELGRLNIRYTFNETDYGVALAPVWQSVAEGKPQILITNMQQFATFKEALGDLVVCVYLHATRTRRELYRVQLERHRSIKTARLRIEQLSHIHDDYIRQIADYQHVLLNTIQKEDFWEQMFRLIEHYQRVS